jgi:formylglycine-generating enzyme required for sulfatase activity
MRLKALASFPSAIAAAIGMLAGGCRTPTQVTVEISTDLPCGEVPDTTVQVGRIGSDLESRPVSVASRACGAGGRIGSFVVVPSGEPSDEFGIKVILGHGGRTALGCRTGETTSNAQPNCIFARRGLHYLPNTELVLPIVLRADCDGIVCPDPTTTCVHGGCVRAVIDDPGICRGTGCSDTVLGPADAGSIAPDAGLPHADARDGDVDDVAVDEGAVDASSDRDASEDDGGGPSRTPPSCATGLTCGTGESCCESLPVTGDPFLRMNDPDYPASVSSFRLDKYETTVGRFRAFVEASSSWRPPPGSGKHAHLAGGGLLDLRAGATEPGWHAEWNTMVPERKTIWDSTLTSCTPSSWTPTPGANERRPIVCVSWFEAYAFCIWDGGFLPSYAEWNYAFVGGRDQRPYPWGDAAPDASHAQYCSPACGTLTNVGSKIPGNGFYGHADLAGNAFEWVLDSRVAGDNCHDCVDLDPAAMEALTVGGGWDSDVRTLAPSYFTYDATTHRDLSDGFRCARPP